MRKPVEQELTPSPMVEADPYAMAAWRALEPDLRRLPLLGIDLVDVEKLCFEEGTYRHACQVLQTEGLVVPGSTKNQVPSPWLKIRNESLENSEKLLSRIGLTYNERCSLRRQLSR